MTIEGFVACNCYKEGKTIDPPFKEFLHFDNDGISIMIPDEEYVKHPDDYHKIGESLSWWISNACEHHRMLAAEVSISSIKKMNEFIRCIMALGGEAMFPTICKYSPLGKEGSLPAEFAAKALQELSYADGKRMLFTIMGEDVENGTIVTVGEMYKSVFDAFRILLDASLATGNPVVWDIPEEAYKEL